MGADGPRLRHKWVGPLRGGGSDSWVLLFNKELGPNQIMSLRTLQKASYFTHGNSLGFNNGHKACRIWGACRPGPPTSGGLSSLAPLPSLLSSDTPRGFLPLEAPPDGDALLPAGTQGGLPPRLLLSLPKRHRPCDAFPRRHG